MQQTISNAQTERLEAAKKVGYFVGLPEDRFDVTNLFYRWCDSQNKPYVFAIQSGRKYYVELDTASYTQNLFKLSEEGMRQVERLWRTLLPYGCECSFGGEYARISDVPPEHVEAVCRAFVAILQYFKEDWKGHMVMTRIIREIGGDD